MSCLPSLRKIILQLVTRGFWGFDSCCGKSFERVGSSCCTGLVASSLSFPKEEGTSCDNDSDLLPGELWALEESQKKLFNKILLCLASLMFKYYVDVKLHIKIIFKGFEILKEEYL